MLKERPQRVVIGGGQRTHQVPHTAETLGRILQLWARDGSEGGGGETEGADFGIWGRGAWSPQERA